MTKKDKDKVFDGFAWQIYPEMEERVEKHITENADVYNAWLQEKAKKESNAQKARCDKSERGTKK